MTLFHLAEYILQTHAVQATSYTKARAKQLWRLIVGDKDEIDDINVSQPAGVYIVGKRRFWVDAANIPCEGVLLRVGRFHHDTKESAQIAFNSQDELGRIIDRQDLAPRMRSLIDDLNLELVARPNGRAHQPSKCEACTPP